MLEVNEFWQLYADYTKSNEFIAEATSRCTRSAWGVGFLLWKKGDASRFQQSNGFTGRGSGEGFWFILTAILVKH